MEPEKTAPTTVPMAVPTAASVKAPEGSGEERSYRQVTMMERASVLRLRKRYKDLPLTTLATMAGLSLSTVRRILDRWDDDVADLTRELMTSDVEDAIEDWKTARYIAALKGKHAPAKEWLLHAGAIDPIDEGGGSTVNVNVAVATGTPPGFLPAPSAPALSPPDVVVSPVVEVGESETD